MERARSVRWAATVGLALAAVGCTAAQPDPARPAPSLSAEPADCADPRYEFTPAVQTDTLTYVTPVFVVIGAEGGPVHFARPMAVRSLTGTASSSAGRADARRAYDEFVRRSQNNNMPAFGVPVEPFIGSNVVSIRGPGRFLAYGYSHVVTSTFVRYCGVADAGRGDAVGAVTTFWPRFTIDTVADCATQREEVERQAAQLMCGTPG